MVFIHSAQHIKGDAPVGAVIVHSYFLPDYSLLLAYCLRSEIGRLNKIKQNCKVIVKPVGAGKKIAGAVKRGKGVCRRSRFGVFCKGVAVLAFKELMLQKVRNTLGHAYLLAVYRKAGVNRAVFCAEYCIGRIILRLFKNIYFKPRGVHRLNVAFAYIAFKNLFLHYFSSFGKSLYTVCSFTPFAAAIISSRVTALIFSAISSGE